jgi:hypothetical protein
LYFFAIVISFYLSLLKGVMLGKRYIIKIMAENQTQILYKIIYFLICITVK